jgi:ABC-type sulfate transport system permease subunit
MQVPKKVQAEVDVAISIRIAKEVFRTKHPIEEIILIGGDRDFNDAIDLARERDIMFMIIGSDKNVSIELQQKQGVRIVFVLSQIIEALVHINVPMEIKELMPLPPMNDPKKEAPKKDPPPIRDSHEFMLGDQSSGLN